MALPISTMAIMLGNWEEAFSHLTQFLEQEGIAECLNATTLTMVIG
jgi:hypothetical protein